jgi:hypothetical protein
MAAFSFGAPQDSTPGLIAFCGLRDYKHRLSPFAHPRNFMRSKTIEIWNRTTGALAALALTCTCAYAGPAEDAHATSRNQAQVAALFAPGGQFYGTNSPELVTAALDSPIPVEARPIGLTATALSDTVGLVVASATLPAFAAADEAGDDAYTIRLSDIPKDAPRAGDYPATPYAGPHAAPDVRSDPRSTRYRTQLRAWAREKPNFAGHYILATWGCGASCFEIAIIDAVTGKVFHPAGARSDFIDDVDGDLLEDVEAPSRREDFGALRYRVDSRLLVLIGTPEQRKEDRGISWFVWDDERLRRIRIVRKPGAPETR